MAATLISEDQARSSIEQALQRVADSAEEQLTALEKCLELIDTHLRPAGPGWVPQNDGEWWWALRRLKMLQHYDRVATTLKLCQGSFNAQLYTELRSANILQVAQSAASCGNFAAITVLLELHPYSLAPNILEVLSCAPETLPAKKIEPLLRQIVALRGAPPTLPRASDWVEIDSVYTLLRRQQAQATQNTENNESSLAPAATTENLIRAGTPWNPPSEAQISSWARRRAATIDKITGQLPAAMVLLESARAALHYGSESQPVAELYRAAQQLLMIVKLAAARSDYSNTAGTSSSDEDENAQQEELDEQDRNGVDSTQANPTMTTMAPWRLDLATFATLDDIGRLQTLFHLLESDDLGEDIPHVILPFLNQLNTETGTPVGRTLRRALEGEASTRLSWVVAFIQLESQRPVVFETAGDLASAACATAYACSSTEAWSLQEKLLHAAVEAIESDSASEPEERQALLSTVAQVHGHLTAARVLTKHGLSTTLLAVRNATRDDILIMVRTLLARVARAKPAESRWVDLWADLKAAQSTGLQVLPLEDVRAEMCRALLRCNQLRPAQKHLAALQDATLREELVLDAARDAVYSEENPDDATVRRALDVLKTLPNSKAAVEEASFIHAAAKLRALGIKMPPLQLRQQPDKATLLQKAIAAAPLKALKDVDGLLELSTSLKTGLKKAQVLSLIAEAALALGQPRLAEEVVKQLAYEGSRDGWQIAARVAMEEPCSSESERRRLLAYAMRFAPAEELEKQLHCWQASDAGAAGDSEIWSIPENGENSSTMGDSSTSYIQPVREALDTFLLVGSSSVEDGLLAFSCLNTLGFEGQKQWTKSVERHRGGLDPPALRQAYIVGIASASILALVSTLHRPSTLEEPSTSSETTSTNITSAAAAALAKIQQPSDESSTSTNLIYSDLLSLSPRELLTSVLRVFASSTTADADKPKDSDATFNLESIKTLILDLCQHLVSSSDAQRVARLLPGHQSAENWMEGGAEAQRNVVLQLASSAGHGVLELKSLGVGDNLTEEEEMEEEFLKLAAGSKTDVSSLEQALTLAERCGVDAWEVQLAYAVAVLTRLIIHHCQVNKNTHSDSDAASLSASSLQAAAELDVARVWSSLLESRPNETIAALLSQVYPQLSTRDSSNNKNSSKGSSDAEVDWLVWVLQLCGECFQQCAAASAVSTSSTINTSAVSNEAYTAASSVVDGLAEAIAALHAACSGTDVTIFLNPTMRILKECYSEYSSSPGSGTIHNSSIRLEEEMNAAVLEQLVEHCDSTNVAALAFAVDALARQHAELLNSSSLASYSCDYPATASTVYVVTLCKELSAMALTEGVDGERKNKLEMLFNGTSQADSIATATFACLNGPPPFKFPFSSEVISIFLSPQQSLAVLECALNALGGPASDEIGAALPAASLFLQKERVRLTVLLQIEATCRDDLLEHQVQVLQTLVPQLLDEENASAAPADATTGQQEIVIYQKLDLLTKTLSSLFSDGCSFGAIVNIAEACKDIGSWVKQAVEEHDLVLNAAENAVQCALAALGGDGGGGVLMQQEQQPLSVGDAVQNLYGVIRSLDIDTPATASPDTIQLLETTQSKVWTMLQTHAAEHQSSSRSSTDAAAVEAHLQVLQILGSLGSSMWQGWQLPEGAVAFSTTTGAMYKHAEALLHSRAAAALAATWPSALREVSITSEDFSSLESTEAAVMKLLDIASTVEQWSAVVVLLTEVLDGATFAAPSGTDIHTNISDDDEKSLTYDIIGSEGIMSVNPLHRVWARCLTALLTQGQLDPVISALDTTAAGNISAQSATKEVKSDTMQTKWLVNETETEALVAAADATLGTVAAAAIALLSPYKRIQNKEWAKIVSLQSGDDLQGLSGLTPLALAAVHQQELIVDLARQNPGVFKQLCRALLQRDDVALFTVPPGSASQVQRVPARTGLAVAIAAQLVLGSNASAAAWVAMLHAGTHPFLRIIDSGSTVLLGLLRAGAKLKHKNQVAMSEEIELEPAVRAVLGAGTCAEEILKMMPGQAAAALEQLG